MLLVPIANRMFPFFEDPNDLLKYSPCKKEVTASHKLAKWFERIALPNNLGYSKRLIASHFHSRCQWLLKFRAGESIFWPNPFQDTQTPKQCVFFNSHRNIRNFQYNSRFSRLISGSTCGAGSTQKISWNWVHLDLRISGRIFSSFEFKIWIVTKTKWIQGLVHSFCISTMPSVLFLMCDSCQKWLLCDGFVVLDRPTRVQMWSGSVVWSMVAGILGGGGEGLGFFQVPSN